MLCLAVQSMSAIAQLPDCNGTDPTGFYFLSQAGIYFYDNNLPQSSSNPRLNTIPFLQGGLGLAITRNLNVPMPGTTFYTVRNGIYHYCTGAGWVSTGHSAGGTMAINIGAGGGYIYSLDILTNSVYKYDGTANASLLITIPGAFNGIADVVADCKGNFYLLNTNGSQFLRKYAPDGTLLYSWALSGIPPTNGGGGFSIVGKHIYYSNNNNQFFKGEIKCSIIEFESQAEPWTSLPSDMAECSPCNLEFVPVNDKHYFCDNGVIQFQTAGLPPYSFSIISGSATVTGTGPAFVINASNNAVVEIQSGSVCGTKKDTLNILVPSATVHTAKGLDTLPGCGVYRDTLQASFQANQPGGVLYHVQWSPASGIISGANTLEPIVNPVLNTTYTVSISTPPGQGGCVWKDSIRLIVKDRSVNAGFSFQQSGGCGQDTFDFQSTSINATQNQWFFGDGNTSTQTNPQHVYPSGNYLITLVSGNELCTDTVSKNISLNHELKASFEPQHYIICQGNEDSFNNTSIYDATIGTTSFAWTINGIHSDTTKSLLKTFASPGNYTIGLTVTDHRGCQDTAIRNIVVDPSPDVTSRVSDSTLCTDDEITLTASFSLPGLSGIQWDPGNGDTPKDLAEIKAAYPAPGIYTARFHASYRACPDITIDRDIVVSSKPLVNLGPDTSLCTEATSYIIGNPASGGLWQWNTGAATPTINAEHSGLYICMVTENGCTTTDSVLIENYTCDCKLIVPDAFTPNNDGRNDRFHPLFAADCSVKGYELIVYNRWGQEVFHSFQPSEGWDGYQAENGTYKYMMRYTLGDNYKGELKTGDIMVIR